MHVTFLTSSVSHSDESEVVMFNRPLCTFKVSCIQSPIAVEHVVSLKWIYLVLDKFTIMFVYY